MKYSLTLAATATAASAQHHYGGGGHSAAPPALKPNPRFETYINVNANSRYQAMIGGGCSGAFGAACTTNTLSAADQSAVVDTLFNENIGGLSILRNLIGSSTGATILPTCPATPDSPLNYTSLTSIGNDSCQLTLAQNALKTNPNLFLYADAWSAPGCFKTTGNQAGGGYICGVRRSNCTYDWRETYATYLLEYVRMYEQQGIKVSMLGAYNEPDFNPVTYSGMSSDGYQAYDFLSVLYPMLKKTFPHVLQSCCDSTGARQQRDLLSELDQLGGMNLFDVNTYHNYQSDIKRPFSDLLRGQPTIETEWSDGGSTWVSTWDAVGQNFEGFQWAIYMHNAFKNNVAGWSHWWCSWNGGDAALVNVNGTSYQVAARLWAFSGYFRFARPGAVRIAADTGVEDIYVTAWQNTNGTVAIPVINAAHYTYTLDMSLAGVANLTHGVAYLTDNTHSVSVDSDFTFSNGRFRATIEPRSMKTFFLDCA